MSHTTLTPEQKRLAQQALKLLDQAAGILDDLSQALDYETQERACCDLAEFSQQAATTRLHLEVAFGLES